MRQIGAHFLQSSDWAEFQRAVGNESCFFAVGDRSWFASKRRVSRFSYLFVQCGPTFANGTDTKQVVADLRQAGEKYEVDFVRFEPVGDVDEQELLESHAREVDPVEPKHPWVLDLSPSEEVLRSGLSSGHRYGVNSAGRKGLTFREGGEHDVEIFLNMMHDTTKERFTAHPDDYYRTMLRVLGKKGSAKLFVAELEGKPVASAIVFDWNKTRYYAHAGAFQELNRKISASMPLVWHMIMDAKGRGFKTFDFWGVTPSDDPTHPWAGFSKFKKSFGGQMLTRAGTWELPISANRYRLYTLVKRIKR